MITMHVVVQPPPQSVEIVSSSMSSFFLFRNHLSLSLALSLLRWFVDTLKVAAAATAVFWKSRCWKSALVVWQFGGCHGLCFKCWSCGWTSRCQTNLWDAQHRTMQRLAACRCSARGRRTEDRHCRSDCTEGQANSNMRAVCCCRDENLSCMQVQLLYHEGGTKGIFQTMKSMPILSWDTHWLHHKNALAKILVVHSFLLVPLLKHPGILTLE